MMRDPELEEECPGLALGEYEIRSAADPKYNCISFAVGDLGRYWYDCNVSGYYWPPGVPSADTLEGWVKLFQIHGYSTCEDGGLDPDFEKIAIYATADGPEHVARQKGSGMWVSKMGKGCDIEHPNLEALEGNTIGNVVKLMRRRCHGRRVLE
jgi:hypothetical protein